jgi:hypothetical protein
MRTVSQPQCSRVAYCCSSWYTGRRSSVGSAWRCSASPSATVFQRTASFSVVVRVDDPPVLEVDHDLAHPAAPVRPQFLLLSGELGHRRARVEQRMHHPIVLGSVEQPQQGSSQDTPETGNSRGERASPELKLRHR